MNKYTCDGFLSVEAESMREAAEIFGERLARRKYGKRGQVGACRCNGHTQDGSYGDYDLFIGYPSDQNQTTGHNVMLSIRAAL